ncbi:LAGLIDADG family homing endonuclease [Nocardia tengchongensis]|uniref:LAGLIDADG family homing endonuclease n=1 Tax=Nocardia tengchongensis TaxID=2055889 RepID=UPI0036C7954F
MAKFNIGASRAAAQGPIRTDSTPTGATHEGGPGFAREPKAELFLLAVANMVGENTFYETAGRRDSRFSALVRQVALTDLEWLTGFATWLRGEANMRSAALVLAAEAAKASVDAGQTGSRAIVDAVLQRADEPGEMLSYWIGHYGKKIPKPVKRGVADAAARLYNEKSYLKWDSDSRGVRFADVIQLAHVDPRTEWQSTLFKYAIEARLSVDGLELPARLKTLCANADLRGTDAATINRWAREGLLADKLAFAGMTWEAVPSLVNGPWTRELWESIIPSMGYMACLAEGTPIWLADGSTAPIEEVVARRLPVLSYDKAWDTRPVKYGANQGARDHSVGDLVPTMPSAWLDTGVRPVATIRFASGRTVEATYDHRWVRQRRGGRQAWEWTVTGDLQAGDRVPVPLTANYFGDEGDAWDGYFVGAMLGDGGMTGVTPEFHGDPEDGATAFMREYATKHGCEVAEYANGRIVRMRFPFKQWKRNPLAEVLRTYEVWGKRCEVKALPSRPFSREFWIGVLSGLIDTDGCVRERVNPKGTRHGSIEYATVSRVLAVQVSDALLRLGVTNTVRTRAVRLGTSMVAGRAIQGRHPIHIVEVSRATAIGRLATLLDLRISYKAAALKRIANTIGHVKAASSEMHGYDERVALDRVVSIEDAGKARTYCVTVHTSSLFVANGLVTGNCLRNLRNFDQAGVSDEVAAEVAARLMDPEQVAKSRQLPMRYLSAYRAAPSLRWAHALEKALDAAVSNIPALPGRTLILIDTSGSMHAGFSKDGTLMRWDAATIFGLALARRCAHAEVISYSNSGLPFPLRSGESLLKSLERWKSGGFFIGGGTNTAGTVRATFDRHDRVVILTDEQNSWGGDPGSAMPQQVPLYTWNLAGYQHGHAAGGPNRHTFGGLSDRAFAMIPLLERGEDCDWPF